MNFPPNIHERLLCDAGMRSARQALIDRYKWFYHTTEKRLFEQIQREGLTRKEPFAEFPEIVRNKLGSSARCVVCLWPPETREMRISKQPPWIRVAISASDLPSRIGLDWSYRDWWNRAPEFASAMDLTDVFLKVVREAGSVVSYEHIPASCLRVCPANAPNSDPSDWPLLPESTVDDAARISHPKAFYYDET